jgi:hypothetical protein
MVDKRAESSPLALDDLHRVSVSIWMEAGAALAARFCGHTIPRPPFA